MLILSLVLALLLLLLTSLQLALAVGFYWRVRRRNSDVATTPAVTGKAAVVLSVRGCDPTLRRSLIGLLQQNYENYDIHVVVDNQVDAAWKVVHEIKEEFDLDHRLTIHEMTAPLETCGLKCSALIQALEAIGTDAEYLALLDADVTPHSEWLSSVLSPLADPTIGVVTGNQWFEPVNGAGSGSIIRTLWNAGAVVPTAMYANPWAGTCAMRLDDVYRSGLDQIWRQSVVDDGPIRTAVKPLGLRVHFEPSLIMVNGEQCSTEYVHRYVSRMLTWSKLYERTFKNTVVHAMLSNGLLLAVTLCLLVGLVSASWTMALMSGAAILLNSFISLLAYVAVRHGVRKSRHPSLSFPQMTVRRLLHLFICIPYTQMIYGMACYRAMKAKQVKWREITYEVKSKSQVRMLSYRPFIAEAEYANSEMSI